MAGGLGRGGGPGHGGQVEGGGRSCDRGGHEIPPQYAFDAFTHITKSYNPANQYTQFSAAEKQKILKNKGKQPRVDKKNTGDTSSIK